jgi:hypothetical protein
MNPQVRDSAISFEAVQRPADLGEITDEPPGAPAAPCQRRLRPAPGNQQGRRPFRRILRPCREPRPGNTGPCQARHRGGWLP